MGKPTGFMEIPRELPKERSPKERVNDWGEYHIHMPEEKLQAQGARCMDCGIPFCHTGTLLAGMALGCPVNNLIPEWNDLVYRGLWREALERLHKTNNFPEFTGRICPAPCEGSCVLGINEPPVAIKSIECSIIDKGFEEGWVIAEPPKVRTGKKVAVVGSGPAGLACAAQLNKAGHSVTVFERADRIGGLLMYGIPNPHLDKNIVQRRIDLLEEEGVRFVTNTEIGKNYPPEKLLKEFDASALCCGATKPRDLPIEGRNLKGIHFAVHFLTQNTKALLDSVEFPPKGAADPSAKRKSLTDPPRFVAGISAEGKDVFVIGGGDTGTDCVATSMRHKCKSLIQLEIMPKPPMSRMPDNPWPQWPKVYKMDYGQEEAAAVFGADPRQYLTTVKRFIGNEKGELKEVELIRVEWQKGDNGRPVLKQLEGTEKRLAAQLALIAMGFLGPEDMVLNPLGIERDERSNAKAEYGKYATNIRGVFSAGDMRRGQSLVVWAINEGRGCARAMDEYLMGRSELPS